MKKITPGNVEIISLTDTEAHIPLKALFPDMRAEQWSAYQQASSSSPLTGDDVLLMAFYWLTLAWEQERLSTLPQLPPVSGSSSPVYRCNYLRSYNLLV